MNNWLESGGGRISVEIWFKNPVLSNVHTAGGTWNDYFPLRSGGFTFVVLLTFLCRLDAHDIKNRSVHSNVVTASAFSKPKALPLESLTMI